MRVRDIQSTQRKGILSVAIYGAIDMHELRSKRLRK